MTVACFTAFHIGASIDTAWYYASISLVGMSFGLIYYKTASIMIMILVHAAYDALACVWEQPLLSELWEPVLLLWALAVLCWWAMTERRSS